MLTFKKSDLQKIFKPHSQSNGEDNGQVTIIGGSELFHGAPLFALKIASRIVDMVFFASPEKSLGSIAEKTKSKLMSFIWIPREDLGEYLKKSDAVLIGPGFMRYRSEKYQDEKCDEACKISRSITQEVLTKFPHKKWVIDAGSLQVMDKEWLPENSIITPNKKEYKLLFDNLEPEEAAKKYKCIIVLKGPITYVYSQDKKIEIKGGNPGLTKGGTGDVQAGLTVALLAKNDPLLAASAAAFVVKMAGDELQRTKGTYYNADDLTDKVPEVLASLIKT